MKWHGPVSAEGGCPMHRLPKFVLVAACTVLISFAGGADPGKAFPASPGAAGDQLWARTTAGDYDVSDAIGVDPAGTTAFVTGEGGPACDVMTIAYKTGNGRPRWKALHPGPGAGCDEAHDLAV